MHAHHHPRHLAQIADAAGDSERGCAAAGGIRRGRGDAALRAPVIRRLPAAPGILLLPTEILLSRPDGTGADMPEWFRRTGGFLRRVGILAVDQAETAIDRFHFGVKRRFLFLLGNGAERQKKDKGEHEKSGALKYYFHNYDPLNQLKLM